MFNTESPGYHPFPGFSFFGDTMKLVRTYPISEIISAGIDLTQWPETDWTYDPVVDVIQVKPNTAFQSYLYLRDIKPGYWLPDENHAEKLN